VVIWKENAAFWKSTLFMQGLTIGKGQQVDHLHLQISNSHNALKVDS